MSTVIPQLDALEEKYKELEARSLKYNDWQEVLQTAPTSFDNLEELRDQLGMRCLMWRSLKEWEELTEKWIGT